MGADTIAQALADAIEDPEVRGDPVPDRLRRRLGGRLRDDRPRGPPGGRAGQAGDRVDGRLPPRRAATGSRWTPRRSSPSAGTLTGSIGVFAGKPVLTEFWDELGVNWGQVARGANATMWSTLEGLRGSARAPGSTPSSTRSTPRSPRGSRAAGGSRATRCSRSPRAGSGPGKQAKELGLVDELGGFARALALAKQAAGHRARSGGRSALFPARRAPLAAGARAARRIARADRWRARLAAAAAAGTAERAADHDSLSAAGRGRAAPRSRARSPPFATEVRRVPLLWTAGE